METRIDGCRVLAACFVGVLALVPSASAAPVFFGGNAYEFIQVTDPFTGSNNSWDAANAAAAASIFNGVNGHLATITSQEENDFLFSLVAGSLTGFAGAWLGGKAPEGWLVGPESGQAFTFTNWVGIEPNNAGYAYMIIDHPSLAPGGWADDSGVQGVPDPTNDPVAGYLVEYENAAIPEPSSWLLMGVGLAGLAARKRIR